MPRILIASCYGQPVVCVTMVSYGRGKLLCLQKPHNYDSGVHLNMADISVDKADNPMVVKAKIKASKTDQFRKGVDIIIIHR